MYIQYNPKIVLFNWRNPFSFRGQSPDHPNWGNAFGPRSGLGLRPRFRPSRVVTPLGKIRATDVIYIVATVRLRRSAWITNVLYVEACEQFVVRCNYVHVMTRRKGPPNFSLYYNTEAFDI
jgi:hypothetical protein